MIIKENALTYEIYCSLRESVGWNSFSEEQEKKNMKYVRGNTQLN